MMNNGDPASTAPQDDTAGLTDESLADALAAAASEDESGEEDPTAARIAELEAERDQIKDRMLRALADAENTRRRAAKDREEAEKFGGTRLARDLLAVHDNLDRALQAADDSVREKAKDFIEGVEMTQRELLNAFAKHRIEPVMPELGTKFDANMHQAMFEAPVPHAEPGSIIQVMQPGFTIAGRLLRAAMVGVARADPDSEPAQPAADPDTPEDA